MQEGKPITTYRKTLKERILDVAMKEFAKHGIRAVKMNDIAQLLGISKRTLYELYDNKELLLFEGVKKFKATKERESVLLAAESSNVMDMLIKSYRVKVDEFRQLTPLFFSDLVKYPSVLSYLEADKLKGRGRVLAFIKRGVKEGYFRGDVDYDLLLKVLDALGDYIMGQQLYQRYPIEHLFKNFMFLSLRGFCTKQGIDVLDNFLNENL